MANKSRETANLVSAKTGIAVTISGDICVYKGCEVFHWRTPLQGDDKTYHHQLFLHYVNANGNYLQFAYDNR